MLQMSLLVGKRCDSGSYCVQLPRQCAIVAGIKRMSLASNEPRRYQANVADIM